MVAALVGLYAFEAYLGLAGTAGGGMVEQLQEARASGTRAYPAVFPYGLIKLFRRIDRTDPIAVDGHPVFPLAGIPDEPTIYCEGEHEIIAYRSDTYGFRNAADERQAGPVDIAVLGDSFVQGTCVPDALTYPRAVSRADARTLNFGINGSSPLVQSAIYREYVQRLAPRRVLWFFFEGNDLADFRRESEFAPTRACLDPDHTQNLVANTARLGGAMQAFIDSFLTEPDGGATMLTMGTHAEPFLAQARAFVTLQRLQQFVLGGFSGAEAEAAATAQERLALWAEYQPAIVALWRRVIEMQGRHGGTVTFVYIPEAWRYRSPGAREASAELEARVTAAWSALGARHLSLTGPVDKAADPRALYRDIHFNEEGYRRTSAYLAARLAECGRDSVSQSCPPRSEAMRGE